MNSELTILVLYGFVVMAAIMVQLLMALGQVGLMPLLGNRDDLPDMEGVAGRSLRTLENSVVAMALFAPVILVLNAKGAFTPATLLAAQVFLIARIAYVVVYVIGIPWLRTLIWVAGFLATIYLYLMAL